MTGRIWPGALCYIAAPWQRVFEHGVVVTAIRLGTPGERRIQRNGGETECSGGGLRGWLCDGPGGEFPCFIGENCLRPILPPPGTVITDTDAPAELMKELSALRAQGLAA